MITASASLGFESSMFYSQSQTSPKAQSPSLIHHTDIPSPPPSTRTSIEIPPKPGPNHAPHLNSPNSSKFTSKPTLALPSPPESQVGSPPKTNSIANILLQLQPVLESRDGKCEVDGVTPALLDALKAHMIGNGQAGIWESLRVDFQPDKLIVRVPTIGHEIMTDLFYLMKQSGTGYSTESYRGSRIVLGGSADIHYTSGYKSPDFSLYEVKDGGGDTIDDDNTTPTIVFEIAYTQTTRSVVLEAARHICLTGGEVLLVIAIDIVHKTNTNPRELESVTWSHWEEDIGGFDEVKNPDDYEVNSIFPDRGDDNDEDYVLPPATAFTGVIHGPDKRKKYHIRAVQTDKWRLFPDPEVSRIDILHRHLYREPYEKDKDTAAFSFTTSDIMTVIHEHESLQRQGDRRAKRGLAAELEVFSKKVARKARRQRGEAF